MQCEDGVVVHIGIRVLEGYGGGYAPSVDGAQQAVRGLDDDTQVDGSDDGLGIDDESLVVAEAYLRFAVDGVCGYAYKDFFGLCRFAHNCDVGVFESLGCHFEGGAVEGYVEVGAALKGFIATHSADKFELVAGGQVVGRGNGAQRDGCLGLYGGGYVDGGSHGAFDLEVLGVHGGQLRIHRGFGIGALVARGGGQCQRCHKYYA